MENCNKIFSEVKFFMAQCNRHDEIKDTLIEAGARHLNYLTDQVTHVIADSNCQKAEEAVDVYEKPVVTSLWVHLCIKSKRLLPTEAFSPKRRIFQNVVAAFSNELSKNDIDVLAATLTFYGGKLTKDLEEATHFLAVSTKPDELQKEQNPPHKFKMIAPDWILDSVKQSCCLDETVYEPGLLMGPPPSPPPKLPTPPPVTEAEEIPKSNNDDSKTVTNPPANDEPPNSNGELNRATNLPVQSQELLPTSQQRSKGQAQPQFDPNQQPRMRMVTSMGPQARFRRILPPNQNMPQAPRQIIRAQPRVPLMADTHHSPRQVAPEYNQSFRKMGPYQSGPELQPNHEQHTQQQQPIHTYQQAQHPSMHQQGQTPSHVNRLPQSNMYQQPRTPYQNNQMAPRVPMSQPNMMNHQQMQSQTLNRMQDPSNQMNQPRPYQVAMHNQPAGYQQSNSQRQPLYYNQNQKMQMRMPQQAPPPRMIIQSDHSNHDNFTQPLDNMHPHQQYQSLPQPVYQQNPRHQMPQQPQSQQTPQHRPQQFQQPRPPVVMQSRPQFQPTMPTNVRGPRGQMFNQEEMKANIRHPIDRQPRGPRSSSIQAQPHPSIFDPQQESSYAQMKAKVPILTDNIEYFSHSPQFEVKKNEPLCGCVFKLVEYTNINSKLLKKWTDAIVDAGGRFSESNEELTHIICESRSTTSYSEAIKKGIRCVTIYWINDVLAEDNMKYPWKALHVPTPFMQDDKPLQNQIISITNFKGRERREVKEMILKTGATCTDYFSQTNTLLICGSPGGEKYERAIEWGIPIANCQLLSDFLISGRDFSQMLAHAKYQNFNRGDQLRLDSYVLIRDLMTPWTKPVPLLLLKREENASLTNGTPKDTTITNSSEHGATATGHSDIESIKSNSEVSQAPVLVGELKRDEDVKTDNQMSLKEEEGQTIVESQDISMNIDLKQPNTKADVDMKIVVDAPTNMGPVSACSESNATASQDTPGENILTTNETKSAGQAENNDVVSAHTAQNETTQLHPRTSDEPVRILFTHLEERLQKQLESYAMKLGLSLAASPLECTHLVVDGISRTPKFVCAFSHAKHIVSYKWLIESHDKGQVLDEKAFILQDSEGEKKFSFNLVYSLLKRKKRKSLLFTDFIFFVSPSVMANTKNLKEMIESAGGKITTRKLPTLAQLNQIRASNKRFVVITNQQDLPLCSSVEQLGADLLRVEFVISGILRQDIDIEAHRLSSSQPVKTTTIEALAYNSIVAPSPNKKLRTD